MPLPPPPAASIVIAGEVVCDHCPASPVWVLAYPAVDRYHWPWWDVYGVLAAVHKPQELYAMRPPPLAAVKLEHPGSFRLSLPASGDAHVFALLDADGDGPEHGPSSADWVGRFPRNPAPTAPGEPPLAIVLYPMSGRPDFDRVRYVSPPAPPDAVRFSDVTEVSGLDFRHCQAGDVGLLPIVTGSGALLEDLDGDGDLDLIAVQGRGECAGASRTTALYLNDGHGHFSDATRGSGIELEATGMGIAAADVDSDGDLDVYITTLEGGHLYLNDGHAHFVEVTKDAGVGDDGRWATGATFGDVDGDGRLDLYVVNYVAFSLAPPFTPDAEVPAFARPMLSSPFAFPPAASVLYLNRGGARFVVAPDALGAANAQGKGMAAVLADFDHDGDLDLYVTNDCTRDALYENVGGRFVDVSRRARVDDLSSGMGIAVGDADGDGLPDLYSPHWRNEPVVLYHNATAKDGPRFIETTVPAGLAGAGNGLTGWAASFFDADLDGTLDLFVTNGHTHPGREPGALEPQPLQLFLGDGRGHFRDVSRASGAALLTPSVYRGAAFGDVDGDGDVDAYVVSWNGVGRLLRNDATKRHWLKIRLRRANGERGAIGSRVVLRAGGRTQTRDVVSGTSYLSHSALELVFGLGDARRIDGLEVVWPGAKRESFPPPRPDQALTLVEGQGLKPQPPRPTRTGTSRR